MARISAARVPNRLDLGKQVRSELEAGRDLPSQDESLRWLPDENLAPVRFSAIDTPLEPAASSTGSQNAQEFKVPEPALFA